MPDYLREAFLFRWNILFFLGGAAAAALTPIAGVLLPLVAAGELTYLTGLVSIPRFRAAIDAEGPRRRHRRARRRRLRDPPVSLVNMLDRPSARRAHALSSGCTRVASSCGASPPECVGPRGSGGSAEEIRTPGWTGCSGCFCGCCCRRPHSIASCSRWTSRRSPRASLSLRKSLAAGAEAAATSALSGRSRTASQVASCGSITTDARRRTPSSCRVELDRIEGKIQALAEMAVNRQDPDFLSTQVDSAAESMRQTEKAVSELQHLTGLADQLAGTAGHSRSRSATGASP